MAGGPPRREGERRSRRFRLFHKAGKDLHLKRTVLKAQSFFYIFLILSKPTTPLMYYLIFEPPKPQKAELLPF